MTWFLGISTPGFLLKYQGDCLSLGLQGIFPCVLEGISEYTSTFETIVTGVRAFRWTLVPETSRKMAQPSRKERLRSEADRPLTAVNATIFLLNVIELNSDAVPSQKMKGNLMLAGPKCPTWSLATLWDQMLVCTKRSMEGLQKLRAELPLQNANLRRQLCFCDAQSRRA